MKRYLLLFHIIAFNVTYGQVEKHNLETYWRYKARFEKDFIILPTDQNSSITKAGVSIPALTWRLTSDNKKSILDFTDGNANLSHYLGMLSTEYRLLKNGGYNYDETIRQLYYAFCAIDRLDKNSESYFRPNGAVLTSDKNGWMIRDDVTPQFWADNCAKLGLPNTGVDHFISGFAGFNNSQDIHTKESVSQDNIFHLLEGLALVNKLVGVEYVDIKGSSVDFPTWAKDLTTRVITMMQHSQNIYLIRKQDDPNQCLFSPPKWWSWVIDPAWASLDLTAYEVCCNGFNSNWYIKNPVTNEFAAEGSGRDFDLWGFFSYGLVRAGNKITNTNFDFGQSSGRLQEQLFTSWFNDKFTNSVDGVEAAISAPVYDFISTSLTGLPTPLPVGVKEDIVKKIASSIFDFDINASTIDKDPYKVKTLATTGDVFGTNTFWQLRNIERERYGHFMLMYILLHGTPSEYLPTSTEYQNDKDYFKKLLSLAPCKGPRNFRISSTDDFNEEWSASSRLVWPENRGLQTDVSKKMEYNGLDYMFLHNLYCLVYQSDFRKLTVNTSDDLVNKNKTEIAVDIIASNTISGTSVINDFASNSIRLVPGFHGIAGANFDGKIISSSINYSGYSQDNACNYFYSGRLASNGAPQAEITSTSDEVSPFSVVPNPNHGSFQVILNSKESVNGKVIIKTLSGQDAYTGELIENTCEIDMRTSAKGIYLVLVLTNNKIYKQRFIIE